MVAQLDAQVKQLNQNNMELISWKEEKETYLQHQEAEHVEHVNKLNLLVKENEGLIVNSDMVKEALGQREAKIQLLQNHINNLSEETKIKLSEAEKELVALRGSSEELMKNLKEMNDQEWPKQNSELMTKLGVTTSQLEKLEKEKIEFDTIIKQRQEIESKFVEEIEGLNKKNR